VARGISLTRAHDPNGRIERGDGWAFCFAALLVALIAVALRGTAALALDWEPAEAASQPWRWWTAAFVHLSDLHLIANLAGTALVGALGFVARVPARTAVAWLMVAWPLTQLGLLFVHGLDHYGGLSGVLHAGVALVAVHVVFEGWRAQRLVGIAVLAGLAVKVVMEAPWAGPLQYRSGWDIAIAPAAHASGLIAGVATGLLLQWATQARMRLTSAVVE
jgi:rhomboid family GlyGly-CTERM serine protease